MIQRSLIAPSASSQTGFRKDSDTWPHSTRSEKGNVMSEQKVFLITGASSGIGAATARKAARAGYQLVLVARSLETLQALVEEVGGTDRALALRCDITSWEDQQAIITATLERFGKIDIAFANAGIIKGAVSFFQGEATPTEWREMVLANIYGTALTARATLPELVKTKGHLLLTGSVIGRVAAPGELYSATKWAIAGMGESIRRELGETGVRVTMIEPGQVATTFYSHEHNTSTRPMLSPDDIADAVLYAVNQPPHVDVNEILLRPLGAFL